MSENFRLENFIREKSNFILQNCSLSWQQKLVKISTLFKSAAQVKLYKCNISAKFFSIQSIPCAHSWFLHSFCNEVFFSVSFFLTGMLAMRPKAFLVDMVLCMGLILQGTWQFQMALSLYVEGFIPLGCRSMQEDLTRRVSAGYGTRLSSTLCDIQEARIRAIDLMNLAFNCHIIVVVLFSMMALVIIAKVQGYRRINNSSGYDMTLTSDVDSESKQLKSLSNMTKLSFGRLH